MVKIKNVDGSGAARRIPGIGVVAHGAEVEVPAEMAAGLCAGASFDLVVEESKPARKSKKTKESEKPEGGKEN